MRRIINDQSLVLGVMSGTSMDGLDISCARYYQVNNIWHYDLLASETFNYPLKLKSIFLKAFNGEYSIEKIDLEFGHIIADYIGVFLEKNNFKISVICSHGHTIFHDPKNGYTKQVGSGRIIADRLRVPVVCNFRQQDINLGGQGAPLVPIGDKLLFGQYASCLNLGGMANISFEFNRQRLAFDICPCNMILDFLSQKKGKDFDKYGFMASQGLINKDMLRELNCINYYNLNFPKSLGKENIESDYLPILNNYKIGVNDMMATFVEHIAIQIQKTFFDFNINNAFATGGGVFNKYLIGRIMKLTQTKMIIPGDDIVNFKESIVFGFLGVLRLLNQHNCLAKSTGASRNHSSGDIYL